MWATGSKPGRPVHARGLTLLELMVVLVLIGMATAAASLAFRDPRAGQVEEEAHRLAALLEGARAQSRSSGLAVRWQPAEDGFRFDGLQGAALPQAWVHGGMAAQVQDGTTLLLGPEPVLAPQRVWIYHQAAPGQRWAVATDGVRSFSAQPAAGEAP